MSYYASFQGRVYLGKRDLNGNPTEVRSPGNVADLKLSLKTEVLEHYESQSGQRSLDHRMIKSKSASISLAIEEFTKENLALALYGTHVATTGGTVTDEPVGGAIPVVGDRYFLAHPKVSALIVKNIVTKLILVVLLGGLALGAWSQRSSLSDCADRAQAEIANGTVGAGSVTCKFFGTEVDIPAP